MNAQNSNSSEQINEQFDKLILNDQKRKVVKATNIPSRAVIIKCSDSVLKYTSKLDLGYGMLKRSLESPMYTEASKIQFIKDALADTSGEDVGDADAIDNFSFTECDFWRSSKEATVLIYAYFDKEYEETEEQYKCFSYYKRLKFVNNSQLPDSYEMITGYIKQRPDFTYKYEGEPGLVLPAG